MTTTVTKIHKFEAAGLGKAPFRCVGFSVEKYQACHGAPIQPGSSCDFCGNAIMNVFWILSADDRKFKVGCDCVTKTGDAGLKRQVTTEKAAHERALRKARKDRLTAELKTTAEDRHRDLFNLLFRLAEKAGEGNFASRFARDMTRQLKDGERKNPSPAQETLIEKLCKEHGVKD